MGDKYLDDEESGGKNWKAIVLTVGFFALMMGGLGYFMYGILNAPATDNKKMVQQISILQPPPPPPPEQKVEPPPEPEIEEPIDIPEPDVPEDTPDLSEEPPAEDLGLDAEGGAGSDEFGLVGRKGGKGLLAGSAFGWYAGILKQDVMDHLADNQDIRKKTYSVILKIWIDPAGGIQKYELVKSSNDKKLDASIKIALSELGSFSEPPPSGMPQPIKIRITSRI